VRNAVIRINLDPCFSMIVIAVSPVMLVRSILHG
jgi:hypothetical protein